MTTSQELEYDRSLLGVEYTLGSFHVTREMILRYAHATGDTNPFFTDEQKAGQSRYGGLVAPPTFCNIFITGISSRDIKLKFGNTGLFASQAIECHTPIRPGDTLEAKTKLTDVYAKTGRSGMMVFAVWETICTNQRGETVALVRESYVRRNKAP